MSKRYNFKALDQRTGRLERACTLLEDGERAKIKTREPDPLHPQSRPRTIGLDRAQIVQGMNGEQKLEDRQYTFRVGITASTDLTSYRGSISLVPYSGGFSLTYTAG